MRCDRDLIVVGGGPGGYTAAIHAARQGLNVALVEKDGALGGTCLHRGCIPTKTLLHASEAWAGLSRLARWGVRVEQASFDFSAMQANKERVVGELAGGVAAQVREAGVTTLSGRGVVEAPHLVAVHSGGATRRLTARHVILATGSVPAGLPAPGANLPGVLDSDAALSLSAPPKSMVVIGGGAIGLELGCLYHALGARVTVVEALPRLADRFDHDVSLGLEKSLAKRGVGVLTSCRVRRIRDTGAGLGVEVEREGDVAEVAGETVLVAVGRKPVLETGPELGLELERGCVRVDDRMATNVEDLYAVGDVTGRLMLAHVAVHQALTAVDAILGLDRRMRYGAVPGCIYTSPEAAGVGLTESEAKAAHGGALCGVFPFSANGRARTGGVTEGFVKVVAEPRYRRVVGAHILGPGATELIAELALAVELECTTEELARTVHAHPTLSEATMEACLGMA